MEEMLDSRKPPRVATAPPPPPRGMLARRGRVLVVDDEPVIRDAICRLLGFEHDVADEGRAEDALARVLAGERFDVILCDLVMPGLSGIDFYGELAARAPSQAERVVFMTGGAHTARAKEFLASVPNAWVEKPFSFDWLFEVVERHVRR